MKKILICFILTLVSISGYSQWKAPMYYPADELTAMQKNSILYTMATRRMSNIITQMKTVINVGK